jgi:undecaprenyl-diphosphatase
VDTREEQPTTDGRAHPAIATLGVAILGFLVVAGLALALGALVEHFVVGHAFGHSDQRVERWFADRRTPTWNELSVVGSYFAETVTVLIVLAIALVALSVHRLWPQVGLLAVSLSAEAGVYVVATYVITRTRPAVPRLEHLIVADSYPSGHTAAAVALYGSLAVVVWSLTTDRLWRRGTILLALMAPIIVAISRMYRGMHNPTDVMAGALIGAACVAVGYLSVRAGLAEARRRQVIPEPATPVRLRQAV